MNTSILCLSPFAVKLIRKANLADYVPMVFSDFVFTPMPSDVNGLSFYDAQISLIKETKNTSLGYYGSQQYLINLRNICLQLESSQRIELWVEPSLNSHIHAFHFLTVLEVIPKIREKLFIYHTAEMVGLMNTASIHGTWEQPRVQVTNEIFEEAHLHWNAFRSSTPEAWIDLLDKKSRCFPVFNQIKKRFALELPLKPSGLRMVDRKTLNYISQGMKKTVYVLGNILADQADDFHILTENAIWDAIFSLAAAPRPAIAGLPLRDFDYFSTLRLNGELRKHCFDSQPRLTDFGEDLLNDNANWIDFNETNYWWGGTHINNNNYWVLDPTTETLEHKTVRGQ